MIRYLAGILALTATLAFVGCTETTVETRVVHDTLKIVLARFISMMPDKNASINLKLANSVDSPIFATTLTSTQASYLPLIPDSSYKFYLYNGTQYLDAISLAGTALRKGSINSFALFLRDDGSILSVGGDNNDSLKLNPIPAGFARVRFIYGNAYAYSFPLDLFSDQDFIATANFSEMSGYNLIPSGRHTLSLKNHNNGQATDLSTVGIFQSGMYYTVRYIGDSSHPAILIVEAE